MSAGNVRRLLVRGSVVAGVGTLVGWAVVGILVLSAQKLGADSVRAMHLLAGLSALECAALYLLSSGSARHWLVAVPVALILPSAFLVLADVLGLDGPAVDALRSSHHRAFAFLIFPAGSMAIGLLVGVLLDSVNRITRPGQYRLHR